MVRKKKKNKNPITPPIQTLTNESRTFLLANQRTLVPIQRTIQQNPQLAREIQTQGGFLRLLTDDTFVSQRRRLTLEFTSMQNALMMERFLGDNIGNIPSAQVLTESIRRINGTVNAIAQELEECCEELKQLLKDLESQVKTESIETRRRINQITTRIIRTILSSASDIIDAIGIFRDEVIKLIEEVDERLRVFLNEKFAEILTFLEELENRLNDLIRITKTEIIEVIRESTVLIETTLGEISTVISGIAVTVGEIVFSIGQVLAAIGAATTEINGVIIGEHVTTRNTINSLKPEIIKILNEFKKELKKELDDYLKDIAAKVAEEVSLSVVGESYLKWDNISSYFPSICFLFNYREENEPPRRSQITIRLKKTASELTEQDILKLRQTIVTYGPFSYEYGPIRANYVSANKVVRTTIWASSEGQAEKVLETICKLVEIDFDKNLFSFTNYKKPRPRITARLQPLDGKGLNPVDYKKQCLVTLKKVTLFVNNLEKPINLFPYEFP